MNNHIQTAISEQGIEAYLHAQQHKSLLRFLTCGSVDDGKSTLIYRLLHDSQQIYEDQLKALESDSQKLGTTGEKLDLALLVDGLQAEREQGITIDVAYRYFSTAKRKFIISDTPGHEQYTRNMATGASTCDLAIILIDARKGCWIRPAVTALSRACLASSSSWWRSTRWTWWSSARRCSSASAWSIANLPEAQRRHHPYRAGLGAGR